MNYYAMKLEEGGRAAWELVIPVVITEKLTVWAFQEGRHVHVDVGARIPVVLRERGRVIDINLTARCVPVVSERVGALFGRIAPTDVQRIPACVGKADLEWEILNVLNLVDCLDYKKSTIDYYPADYPDREKAGQIFGIWQYFIRPAAVGGHHVFRVKDWTADVIVSEMVKDELENLGATGVSYEHVG